MFVYVRVGAVICWLTCVELLSCLSYRVVSGLDCQSFHCKNKEISVQEVHCRVNVAFMHMSRVDSLLV